MNEIVGFGNGWKLFKIMKEQNTGEFNVIQAQLWKIQNKIGDFKVLVEKFDPVMDDFDAGRKAMLEYIIEELGKIIK